ncbi:TPR repeat-containing protein [Cryptosporidium muris RN66]|uniref:TPR repeat-containing protein n=1 Tax=Cryptosporidium muris (strain RN66) TaxID=441375 RepID=B6ABR0_CRYMR|nr:TPR repeat-containing protein [Cryptosporidium muris RN66]EEA05263.1 TPR repeat-containing protein [Cryptosporidium muris RN66]|eukprot:XP_002139612.1 TPR repeat-containing protein [Cryptosporidium muris RN66]
MATIGKEAVIEEDPNSKFLVEPATPLPKSCLWKILQRFYEVKSIDAWRENKVPSFITSNTRLAKCYARLIHNYILDFNSNNDFRKVQIIEVGGGHGRFTYIVLRALEKYEIIWNDLGYPDIPFKYIFTDITKENINFLSDKGNVLNEFSEKKWLDFALFDANNNTPDDIIIGTDKKEKIKSDSPIILICNYVLDSLLTDSIAIESFDNIYRSLVSVYSINKEDDITHPDITNRMSLQWSWLKVDLNESILNNRDENMNVIDNFNNNNILEDIKSDNKLEYIENDEIMRSVIKSYISYNRKLSFVLPIGAIKMLRNFHEFSNGNLLVLIGDKGYPDESEFNSIRIPHIAIHGCMSFMVNLHAIKLYFDFLGGYSIATRYKDTFQITCISGKNKSNIPRTIASFIDSMDELIPDTLLNIQRSFETRNILNYNTDLTNKICYHFNPELKTFLSILRCSGHDPYVFWMLRRGILDNINNLNIRQRSDILYDLKQVYKNIYPLEISIDVCDILAQVCLKSGFVSEAIFYFKQSLILYPNSIHPSTYINLAKCYQSKKDQINSKYYCEKALEIDDKYQPAIDFRSEFLDLSKSISYIIIGCTTSWLFMDIIPTLQFDTMYNCIGIFPIINSYNKCLDLYKYFKDIGYNNHHLDELILFDGNKDFSLDNFDYLSSVLESRPDIEAVILDIPINMMKQYLKVIWKYNKHVMTRSPFCNCVMEAYQLLSLHKSSKTIWFDYSPVKYETILFQMYNILKKFGTLRSINVKYFLPLEDENYQDINNEIFYRIIQCLSSIHISIDGTLIWIYAPKNDQNGKNNRVIYCSWKSYLSIKHNSGNNTDLNNDELTNNYFIEFQTDDDTSNFNDLNEVQCKIDLDIVPWEKCCIEYYFKCSQADITLRKEGPVWDLNVNTENQVYVSKIQCIGLQTANNKFRKLCKDTELNYRLDDSIGYTAWWEAIEQSSDAPVRLLYN